MLLEDQVVVCSLARSRSNIALKLFCNTLGVTSVTPNGIFVIIAPLREFLKYIRKGVMKHCIMGVAANYSTGRSLVTLLS